MIAIPVVAAIILAAVVYGIVRAVRELRRRDGADRVSSPRDNTAKSSQHGDRSSEHRESVASAVSGDESEYYEYEYE